jgi:hypothetical protein
MVSRHIRAIKRNRTMGCADNGKCSLAACRRGQHGQLQRDHASLQQHSEHQRPGDRMFEQRTRRHDRHSLQRNRRNVRPRARQSNDVNAPKRYFKNV